MSGLLSVGCNERHNNNLIGEGDARLEFDKYVDSVSIVGIMATGDIMLGEVSKAISINDSTYLLMDRQQRALIKMTTDGRIVDKFQRLGRGQNEYIDMDDFDIDKKNGHIYILCDGTKIMVVNMDFNPEYVIPLDQGVTYQRIACFEDRWYLYSHNALAVYELGEKNNAVPLIKSKRPNKGLYFTNEPVFHKTGDALLVCMSNDDIIYKLNDGRYKEIYTLNWRDKEERYRLLAEIAPQDIEAYAKNAPPIVVNLILDGERLTIFYSRGYFRMAVANLRTGEISYDGIVHNALDYEFPMIDINDDPAAYFFITDSLINQNFYNVDYHIDKGDDAILVKYRMKQM